jgi:hypothetical protein
VKALSTINIKTYTSSTFRDPLVTFTTDCIKIDSFVSSHDSDLKRRASQRRCGHNLINIENSSIFHENISKDDLTPFFDRTLESDRNLSQEQKSHSPA